MIESLRIFLQNGAVSSQKVATGLNSGTATLFQICAAFDEVRVAKAAQSNRPTAGAYVLAMAPIQIVKHHNLVWFYPAVHTATCYLPAHLLADIIAAISRDENTSKARKARPQAARLLQSS
jgi:hypothetical protein